MKLNKQDKSPLGLELTHGASDGTSGSCGIAINLASTSEAQEKGDTMYTLKLKHSGVRVIIGTT